MKIRSLMSLPLCLVWSLWSCSAKTDDEGQCKLSCKDNTIGAGEFKVYPLVESFQTACIAGQDFRLQALFRIVEEVKLPKRDAVIELARGGISFQPYVTGIMDATKTHETLNKAEYAGIATPADEWCSDSCGRVAFVVYPTCISQNQVTISLSSGSMHPEKPITVTIP